MGKYKIIPTDDADWPYFVQLTCPYCKTGNLVTGDGTMAYTPEHPGGVLIDGASVWQLNRFMELIAGEKAR